MKISKTIFALLSLVGALAICSSSSAAIVNFEGMAGGDCVQTQIDAGGLSFNTGYYQCLRNTATGTQGADNGTDFLINGFSSLTVSATSGNPFDLYGLDLGISFYNGNSSDQVTLTAFLHGGGTSAEVLNVGQSFASYSFNLTGLDAFSISSPALGGGYVAVDNIDFSQGGGTVPEPESIALVGLALAGLGLTRRKAKQA